MKRKTPHRHQVTDYTRENGRHVSSYMRGRGERVNQRSHPHQVVGRMADEPLKEAKSMTVNFTYSDEPDDGESVIVIVDPNLPADEAYKKALDEAFEEKVDPRWPIKTELVDPSIGAVLEFIGKGAKKVGELSLSGAKALGRKGVEASKLGAKYAIRAGHVAKQVAIRTGKAGYEAAKATLAESAKMALFELQRRRVQVLLRDADSKNTIIRRSARWALKRYYPDVYDICSFSKDRNRPWLAKRAVSVSERRERMRYQREQEEELRELRRERAEELRELRRERKERERGEVEPPSLKEWTPSGTPGAQAPEPRRPGRRRKVGITVLPQHEVLFELKEEPE